MLGLTTLAWIILTGLFAWAGLYHARSFAATLLPLMLALSIGMGLLTMEGLWGQCKPYQLEARTGEPVLLKPYWREGDFIWLWVDWGEGSPVCYEYPWSNDMVEAVLRTQEESARASGDGESKIVVPFGEYVKGDASILYLEPPATPPYKPNPDLTSRGETQPVEFGFGPSPTTTEEHPWSGR